jgi:hypothetical protein
LHYIAPVMMLPIFILSPLLFGEMSRNRIIIRTTIACSVVMVVRLGFGDAQ